ncbi:MAG: hypothetical protein ACK41T_06590 [Pseudobdellovibrio sp.]
MIQVYSFVMATLLISQAQAYFYCETTSQRNQYGIPQVAINVYDKISPSPNNVARLTLAETASQSTDYVCQSTQTAEKTTYTCKDSNGDLNIEMTPADINFHNGVIKSKSNSAINNVSLNCYIGRVDSVSKQSLN